MPALTLQISDVMRTSGYVAGDRKALQSSAKSKLVEVLGRGIEALPDPAPALRTGVGVQVWLAADSATVLDALGAPAGLDAASTASALLQLDFEAWVREHGQTASNQATSDPDLDLGSLGRALARRGRLPRPEQARFLATLRQLNDLGDRQSGVLFAEAGTGIGKTSAYLGHVVDYLAANPTARSMVAVPTYALLAQLEAELVAFGDEAPNAVFLSGQNEWVSATALADLLSEGRHLVAEHEVLALEAWLRDGGASSDEPTWSVTSLLSAAPDFQFVADVTVSKRLSEEDAGWHAYQLQFVRAASARLVILTHAMLGWLVRRRLEAQSADLKGHEGVTEAVEAWRALNAHRNALQQDVLMARSSHDESAMARVADQLDTLQAQTAHQRFYQALNAAFREAGSDAGCDRLPDVDLLVVDEAHALEDTFAQVFGTHESMFGLLGAARALHDKHARTLSAQSTAQLSALNARLKAMGAVRGQDDVVPIEAEGHMLSEIADALLRACEPRIGASKAAVDRMLATPEAKRLARVARALMLVKRLQQSGGKFMGAFLHWSPHRDYPRLTIGKSSLDREFHYLWTVVAKRTALVSGTLYEEMPTYSCTTMARALGIPQPLVLTMEPIHAQWQRDPVELRIVGQSTDPGGRARFVRPSFKLSPDERAAATDQWVADIASYVHALATPGRTAGGVLVVGTAFSDIQALADQLTELGPGWTLLVQRPGVGLSGLRQQFLEASKSGRAMLLAVGSAWTGFDLYSPALPDALTDLVILNAPFGILGDTLPRLRRQAARAGHFDVASHALVLVRQVVGRLVRSPNTPHNRRIHWLDARIHDLRMKAMLVGIVRFLAKYRSVVVQA